MTKVKTHMGTEYEALADPKDGIGNAELLKMVVSFYHQTLLNDGKGVEYLQFRKCVTEEAVRQFKIGYSNRSLGYKIPSNRIAVGKALRSQLTEIGIYRESGHEHLCGSVVFPVFDGRGDVVQIYGRKINKNLRKGTDLHLYLNEAHAGVWNHFGVQGKEEWILCESIIDALSFWSHGWKNVTASYGVNGFTSDHWKLLRGSNVRKVFIAYDNDDSGLRGANELAQQLEAQGIEAWRVETEAGSDINAVVKRASDPKNDLAQLLANPVRMVPKETGVPTLEVTRVTEKQEPQNTIENGQADFTFGNAKAHLRCWRVRGLDKNNTFEQLKVTVRLEAEGKFHYDTFDLYNARARGSFLNTAVSVTGVSLSKLEGDVSQIISHLEAYQDARLIKKMAATEQPEIKLDASEEKEALALLKSPKLMQRVLSDIHKCGLVGEDTNLLMAWLVSLSRKLDRPLGVCVMSRSSAGKSSLLDAVARFVPDEDRFQFTALTPQALFHMPENQLAHKALFLAEDEGADGAAYSLKTIQSDGQLVMACTMKDEDTGQLMTKSKVVKGPVAIFLTSTSRSIDDELLNRLLVLTIDESSEQTRRILKAQLHAQTLEGIIEGRSRDRIVRLQKNLQRLIRPMMVRNPLVDEIEFGNNQLRLRRDHQKYLDLINVMALVHQYQREVHSAMDAEGNSFNYIEVTREDIERVDSLMADILAYTTDEVSPQSRRLLGLLEEMASNHIRETEEALQDIWWTRRQIREATSWSDRQVRQGLQQLVDFELIKVRGSGVGRTHFYQLADPPQPRHPSSPPRHSERRGVTPSTTGGKPLQKGTSSPRREMHARQKKQRVTS